MDLPSIDADGFTLRAADAGGRLEVRLVGNADMRVADSLDRALENLAAAMPKQPRPELAFDIRELYFMNSSCFKCFVSLIVTTLDLPKPQQFALVFLSNPRMHWQDRSLEALKSIAADLVRIEASP
jgi:hypothetical protein